MNSQILERSRALKMKDDSGMLRSRACRPSLVCVGCCAGLASASALVALCFRVSDKNVLIVPGVNPIFLLTPTLSLPMFHVNPFADKSFLWNTSSKRSVPSSRHDRFEGSFSSILDEPEDQTYLFNDCLSKMVRNLMKVKNVEERLIRQKLVMKHQDSLRRIKVEK
jgi:hypothetical protein